MKKFIYTLVMLTFAVIVNAQWEPDVRMSNNNVESDHPSIAVSGTLVHVVWDDYRNGNFEIYYKRSTDGGVNWGAETRLTNYTASSSFPSIAVIGSNVHVVWDDLRNGNDEIYYKRSTDAGLSWGADTRLTNNTGYSTSPSIEVSGTILHVVWIDNSNGVNNFEIYYKRSTDDGVSWGADTRLTNDPANSYHPSIAVSGTLVHVVWDDYRDGNNEIYYKNSTDGGTTWGADTRLTNNTAYSEYPSIVVSGSVLHVVWYDYRDVNYEIYYKRSTDSGINWGADTNLTNNSFDSGIPSAAVSGTVLHIVWTDNRHGASNTEIYYKCSTEGGINWGTDTRLTNNSAYSYDPSVAVSGSVVHVVWVDERDGNMEIYYKRNPTGNLTEIQNISTEIPSAFSLSQNYPNPFNPTTVIRFSLSNGLASQNIERFPVRTSGNDNVVLKVFDIMGREVATLVNEQLAPGTYETTFDGSNLSSGTYFYKLTTGDFIQTKKLILLK